MVFRHKNLVQPNYTENIYTTEGCPDWSKSHQVRFWLKHPPGIYPPEAYLVWPSPVFGRSLDTIIGSTSPGYSLRLLAGTTHPPDSPDHHRHLRAYEHCGDGQRGTPPARTHTKPYCLYECVLHVLTRRPNKPATERQQHQQQRETEDGWVNRLTGVRLRTDRLMVQVGWCLLRYSTLTNTATTTYSSGSSSSNSSSSSSTDITL